MAAHAIDAAPSSCCRVARRRESRHAGCPGATQGAPTWGDAASPLPPSDATAAACLGRRAARLSTSPASCRAARAQIPHGRRAVSIIDVQPVGSYAVRLGFDDLHTSGIYSWWGPCAGGRAHGGKGGTGLSAPCSPLPSSGPGHLRTSPACACAACPPALGSSRCSCRLALLVHAREEGTGAHPARHRCRHHTAAGSTCGSWPRRSGPACGGICASCASRG